MCLLSTKHPNTFHPDTSQTHPIPSPYQHTLDLSHPGRNNRLHIPLHPQHLPPQIPLQFPQKLKSPFPPPKNRHPPNLALPQHHTPQFQPPPQQKRPRAQKPLSGPLELLLQRTRMGRPRSSNSRHENKPSHPAPLLPPLRLRRPLICGFARISQTSAARTPKQRRRTPDSRHRIRKWVLDVYASAFPRGAYRGDQGVGCAGCR